LKQVKSNNELDELLQVIMLQHATKVKMVNLKLKAKNGLTFDKNTEAEPYQEYRQLKIEKERLAEKKIDLERRIDEQRRKLGLKPLSETIRRVDTGGALRRA
jgi:hypothetical protein